MSAVCERCYKVVQQPCRTATEWADCANLKRKQAGPITHTYDGPLTRLRKANQGSKK